MELKPLPCPCCGSEARIAEAGGVCFSVYCSNVKSCGLTQFLFDSEEEAIEAWNRRVGEGEKE